MSASVVDQFETEIRTRRLPCQMVPPSQQMPSYRTSSITCVGQRQVAEPDQHLVEHGVR